MRNSTVKLAGASALALAVATPAFAQDAATPAPPADPVASADSSQDSGLQDIIVTAQKREQRLQDVPVSVTALTAESIKSNRIQNVLDLNGAAPNLTARASSGGSNLPTVTMRGMYASGAVPGAEKQVGFYIDGVYVAASGGSVFDLSAIDRIEVLRGPQGTLFGQNATAGAISIYTSNPTSDFSVRQEATLGNYNQLRSLTQINTGQFGPLSALFTYEHFQRDGDIRNLGAGTVWDYTASGNGFRTSPKTLGAQNRELFQAAVALDLGAFTANYKFFYVDLDSTPEGNGLFDINPAGLGAAGALLTAQLAANPGSVNFQEQRPDAINNWFSLPSHFVNQGHILTAQYRASDAISFKNTLGYLKNTLQSVNDLDSLGGLTNQIPLLGPVGEPFVVYVNSTGGYSHQFSDEFQVNIDTRFADITGGFLHFQSKTAQGGVDNVPNSFILKTLPDFVVPATTLPLNRVKTKSDALYAQGDFHVTRQLDLTAGIRYTWDRKTSVTQLAGLPPSFSYKDSRPTYTLGASYKATPDIMVYGKYSTAYMAGGAFAGWSWQPERARSWEAGVKTELFDRHVRFNLALFSVKYLNTQGVTSGTVLANNLGRPELAAIPATVANIGDARARGFEIDGSLAPVRGLTIGYGVGYTDSKYTRISSFFPSTLQMTYRPKWTANGSITYDTPEIFSEGFLRMSLNANYRSKYDIASTDYTPRLAEFGYSPGTTIINGRIAMTNMNFGPGKLEVALWARNLTNEKEVAFPIATPFIVSTTYERARTWGMDIGVKF